MEWWKIIVLVYVALYLGLLIYQVVDNQNKKRDKIKFAMERAELQDKTEKKMENMKAIIDKPAIVDTTAKTAYTSIVQIQKWFVDLVYSVESTIRRQIEWVNEMILSTAYVFLRKSRIL